MLLPYNFIGVHCSQWQLPKILPHKTSIRFPNFPPPIVTISFPVVRRLLDSSRHSCRFTASSDVKFLCFITHSPLLSHFGPSSPFSSSRWSGHYSLRSSAILHAYYVTIPFQHIVFHSIQNCLCYPHFFSNHSLLHIPVTRPLHHSLSALTSLKASLWAGIAQSVQRLARGWMVRGSNPGGCRDFPHPPGPVLKTTQLSIQWVPGFSRG